MYKPPDHLYTKYCIGPTFGKLIYYLMISNHFKNVLEIGCLNGYSTHSFISALKDGAKFNFTICDLDIKDSVKNIIKKQKVTIKEDFSKDVINKNFDFIFVDGDHSLYNVCEEIFAILNSNTKTVLAHDTFIDHPDFKGALFLRKVLSNNKNYKEISYGQRNQKDLTHYGISLFTQDDRIFSFASKLFNLIADNSLNVTLL